MLIKTVLAPVDFSPPSRVAVNYAIALARKCHAKLTLLHVVESPTGFAQPFVENARWETEHRDQAWRMLSALVAPEDEDDLDLQIVTRCGDIEAEIASVIKDYKADVVVMGTHGRGLFGRWMIGSVTQNLLRKLAIPILTVSRVARPLTFQRIVFATDISSSSVAGFKIALDLAQMMSSDLIVMHAVEKVNLTYGGAEIASYVGANNIEEARKTLTGLVAEGGNRNVRVELVVTEGNAAEEIFKVASDNAADLILMTIQGKGILERALMGSTAERVIREASIPVISVPAGIALSQEEMTGAPSSQP